MNLWKLIFVNGPTRPPHTRLPRIHNMNRSRRPQRTLVLPPSLLAPSPSAPYYIYLTPAKPPFFRSPLEFVYTSPHFSFPRLVLHSFCSISPRVPSDSRLSWSFLGNFFFLFDLDPVLIVRFIGSRFAFCDVFVLRLVCSMIFLFGIRDLPFRFRLFFFFLIIRVRLDLGWLSEFDLFFRFFPDAFLFLQDRSRCCPESSFSRNRVRSFESYF